MKKFTILILVIVLAAVGFAVWYQAAPKTATAWPLKISLVPWIGNGIYYVAQEKGFFAKEKVSIEFVDVADIATARQLLQTGQVDVAYSLTPESVAVLNDAGVKVTIVAANDLSAGADGIIATKEIQRVEDLKGKQVAFEVGSTSHFLLSYLLNEKGLSTKDIKVFESIAPDAGAAFVAGKTDAAVTWEPWLSKAGERAGGHLLASSKEVPVIFDMPIIRTEVAEVRKQDIQAMLRAVFAAQKWIEENEKESADIIAKAMKIAPQEAADQMQSVHWLSYEENLQTLTMGTSSVKNAIQIAGDLWFKLGLVKTKVDASKLVDDSFLKNLY